MVLYDDVKAELERVRESTQAIRNGMEARLVESFGEGVKQGTAAQAMMEIEGRAKFLERVPDDLRKANAVVERLRLKLARIKAEVTRG